MNIADKIITLRRKQGMSQEQLADRLGVTRQSVSKWESGASVPELAKIISMSEMFQVSVDYLVKDVIEDMEYGHHRDDGYLSNSAVLEEKITNIESYFRGYEFVSKTTIAGIPLVCIRFSRVQNRKNVAKGIIAIGNIAIGAIAIGAVSVGIVSFGAISVGLLAIGAVAGGIAAVGAVAFGVLAFGCTAIGIYAGGVAACGKEVAVGVAAAGKTAVGETVSSNHGLVYYKGITRDTVRAFILESHPKIWKPLLELFSYMGTVIK